MLNSTKILITATIITNSLFILRLCLQQFSFLEIALSLLIIGNTFGNNFYRLKTEQNELLWDIV